MQKIDEYATYPLTDAGNAERLAARYGEDLKYVADWKQWLWWTGTHWQRDAKKAIVVAAKETARSIRGEALSAPPEIYGEISAWAARSESRYRLQSMIELGASEKIIARGAEDFDKDPYLLNVVNGTLDLLSGILREHSRSDLLTKCLSVDYDPGASHALWNQFLKRIQPQQPTRNFIQRAVGYSLCGSVEEQCLFFLYGTGANGKTTFIETLRSLLSEYSVRVQSRALLSKSWRTGAGPSPNIARLKGARMAVTSELESGGYLDESLVKDLTGGDSLVARYLHANLFEFRPTHKLWMVGNYKPGVKGVDLAIWRRIRLIPFTVAIPPDEQDRRLINKLRGELSGILNWTVKGFRMWQDEGLGPSRQVIKATQEYRTEMDRLGGFLDACCTVTQGSDQATQADPGSRVRTSHLYQVYCDWCKANEMRPLNSTNFAQGLKTRGFSRAKKSGHTHFFGLVLKPGEWT